MTKVYNIDGIPVNLVDPNLGKGGQGRAEKVVLASNPSINLVVKHVPADENVKARIAALIKAGLAHQSPFLAAPIAVDFSGKTEILHLALMAEGVNLESDNRSFPENMEIAHHFACLTTLLEEMGLAHGDIAPSNIFISKEGEVYLIDFDNFFSVDPSVPPPSMAGQHMMLAPELRGMSAISPNMETDRFAYGVLYNILLLRRHPAQNASVPTDVENIMSSGKWPERSNLPNHDDVPIEALGHRLCRLFDDAFSVDPNVRPDADTWRRAFSEALSNMVIHDCGDAFVLEKRQTHCPWCVSSIERDLLPKIGQIKITIPSLKVRYGVPIQNGQPITLGRDNLGDRAPSVSGKHLEITPMGSRFFFRHIGRNPTSILLDGQWYNLKETWIEQSDITLAPVTLKLANLHIDISV